MPDEETTDAHTSIVDQFERIVRSNGNAPALVGPAGTMTFNELNGQANRLGRLIQKSGATIGCTVGLHVRRGPERIVAMLAILKAGAAYVPLDPKLPGRRRHLMLTDAECTTVVATDSDEHVTAEGRAVIDLDQLQDDDLPRNEADLGVPIDGKALAYVIYTSGSTGKPKGVLVEHCGVVALASSLSAFFGAGAIRRHYQFFNVTFDASVWEIFFALLNGLELMVDGQDPAEVAPDVLLDELDASGVDCFMTTPSFLARAEPRRRQSLRTIVVCGEICPVTLARAWAQDYKFVNAYGPTENTVAATMGEYDPADATVSIGHPLAHVQVRIVGANDRVLASGEVGEICLAGTAVARGYHRRAAATARAFGVDRASKQAGARVYRTGDLGYERHDGKFEFVGRKDNQVKIRGHRVELGEIEAKLRELPWVVDAVVVAYGPQAHRSLAAFLVARESASAEAARRYVNAELPNYMVPVKIEIVPTLPVLPSGKVNRRQLQESVEPLAAGYVPDRTKDTNAAIAAIWCSLLGRTDIEEDQDFFALGGHSVLAAQVVARVSELLDKAIPLRLLFEVPELGPFCEAAIARAGVSTKGTIAASAVKGAPSQSRTGTP